MFLVFFISFCTSLVAGDDKCSDARCGREKTEVHFRFTLEGHQDISCGYLSRDDETNGTVLDLGTLGKFSVRSINYIAQKAQLYDQDICLPKRLMNNFDLTDTPFNGYNYQSFNFYNCSPNFSSPFLEPISCLRTPNHIVYALPFFGSRGIVILETTN